ncbi:MAG: hypothetical protein A3G93_02125, partial [Nitrospinae bacterium RIFCSPLOWO2_12_FULL_45_22]
LFLLHYLRSAQRKTDENLISNSSAKIGVKESFQEAWTDVANFLCKSGWEIQNLIVRVQNPTLFDIKLNKKFIKFAVDNNLKTPKAVAYTIFPHKLYKKCGNATNLFNAYNRRRGLYERLKIRQPNTWGTYFKRMTHYPTSGGTINQLANIIGAINNRGYISKAAYTIIIQKAGSETIRPRGGPCLNYLAIQLDPNERTLGILAVYRNHDFLEMAYGNYWGLCNLIDFMARETNFNPGYLTCISSRSYVKDKKSCFKKFVDSTL